MRFLFTDKILGTSENQVRGVKHFSRQSPFRVSCLGGSEVIASGVIGEAVGQTTSWLAMSKTDFRYRPVFAFMDKVEIFDTVSPGTDVHLHGTIDQMNDDSAIFSGEAYVDDRCVLRLTKVTHFLLPLDQTEYVERTRARFAQISAPEGGYLNDDGAAFDFASVVKGFEREDAGMTAHCFVPEDAGFYADHFPKFPVTPIVVINEIIAKTMGQMYGRAGMPAAAVIPRMLSGLKIKSFVKPAEDFTINIKERKRSGSDVTTMVTVAKDGKKILQGMYQFTLPEGS